MINTCRTKLSRDRIDYLFNNAGLGVSILLADATEEQFDSLM
ncbi:hypothetical protein ACE3NQ_12445 [Paenibacillus terreus]|uniref:Short chain dehydrogenase n=1 Tax=Paenibacillus terreus TaxID=1387834 RepID=A0ABV5B7Q8_9BACL